jgi:hypothetical protein
MGAANVNFFGLRGQGHRICLVVDVSLSMAEDERGGLRGYQAVKRRVAEVLKGLQDGALFNVVAFEDAVARLWEEMQPANARTREEAVEWVQRFNTIEGPYGLRGSNYAPGDHGIPAAGGSSRLDLALTAAFEVGADTIFVITDGVPLIRKALEGAELEAYRRAREQAPIIGGGERIEVSDAELRDWEKRVEAWEKEQERRLRKGLGPQVREGGRTGPPPRPQSRTTRPRRANVPWPMWGEDDVLRHIETLQKEFYEDQGKRPAKVHVVGYEVDDGTRSFLRRLARLNRGQYRGIGSFN